MLGKSSVRQERGKHQQKMYIVELAPAHGWDSLLQFYQDLREPSGKPPRIVQFPDSPWDELPASVLTV